MAAGDHHSFDDEPVHELPADEPRTPGWVPGLGLGIFLVTLVTLLARGNQAAAPNVATPEPLVPAQAAAPPPPATQPPVPMPLPRPTAAGSAAPVRQLTPEQTKELQKRIEEMKQRRAAGSSAPTAPAPGR